MFPGDDIEATLIAFVKTERVLYLDRFRRKKFSKGFKGCLPVFTLIRLFIDARHGLGGNFDFVRPQFSCLNNGPTT